MQQRNNAIQHQTATPKCNATQQTQHKRNATQRNTTQHNTTQRNSTQRNAAQRNATQRNATQKRVACWHCAAQFY
jgi:hypothetical protein